MKCLLAIIDIIFKQLLIQAVTSKLVSVMLPYLLPVLSSLIPEQSLTKLKKAAAVKQKNTIREKYEALLSISQKDVWPLDLGPIKKYFDNDFLDLDFQIYLTSLVLKKEIECQWLMVSNAGHLF